MNLRLRFRKVSTLLFIAALAAGCGQPTEEAAAERHPAGGGKADDFGHDLVHLEGSWVEKGTIKHRFTRASRAMFYMAVAYELDIAPDEEAALRQWHLDDPVDAAERRRSRAIHGLQASRNFFVDQPALVERISDF